MLAALALHLALAAPDWAFTPQPALTGGSGTHVQVGRFTNGTFPDVFTGSGATVGAWPATAALSWGAWAALAGVPATATAYAVGASNYGPAWEDVAYGFGTNVVQLFYGPSPGAMQQGTLSATVNNPIFAHLYGGISGDALVFALTTAPTSFGYVYSDATGAPLGSTKFVGSYSKIQPAKLNVAGPADDLLFVSSSTNVIIGKGDGDATATPPTLSMTTATLTLPVAATSLAGWDVTRDGLPDLLVLDLNGVEAVPQPAGGFVTATVAGLTPVLAGAPGAGAALVGARLDLDPVRNPGRYADGTLLVNPGGATPLSLVTFDDTGAIVQVPLGTAIGAGHTLVDAIAADVTNDGIADVVSAWSNTVTGKVDVEIDVADFPPFPAITCTSCTAAGGAQPDTQPLTIAGSILDKDAGDPLTWTLTVDGTQVATGNTATIAATYAFGPRCVLQNPPLQVVVTASDGKVTRKATLTVNVDAGQDLPTLSPLTGSVDEGAAWVGWTGTASGDCVNGTNPVTYSLTYGAQTVTATSTGGVTGLGAGLFSGPRICPASPPAPFTATLTADLGSGVVSPPQTLSVITNEVINDPPTVAITSPASTVQEGSQVTLTSSATDECGVSAVNRVWTAGSVTNLAEGAQVTVPAYCTAQSWTVSVAATDTDFTSPNDGAQQASDSRTVTITPGAGAGIAGAGLSPAPTASLNDDQTLPIQALGTAYCPPLGYAWTGPGAPTDTKTALWPFTPPTVPVCAPTTYTIGLTESDAVFTAGPFSTTVTVNESQALDYPQVAFLDAAPTQVEELGTLTLSAALGAAPCAPTPGSVTYRFSYKGPAGDFTAFPSAPTASNTVTAAVSCASHIASKSLALFGVVADDGANHTSAEVTTAGQIPVTVAPGAPSLTIAPAPTQTVDEGTPLTLTLDGALAPGTPTICHTLTTTLEAVTPGAPAFAGGGATWTLPAQSVCSDQHYDYLATASDDQNGETAQQPVSITVKNLANPVTAVITGKTVFPLDPSGETVVTLHGGARYDCPTGFTYAWGVDGLPAPATWSAALDALTITVPGAAYADILAAKPHVTLQAAATLDGTTGDAQPVDLVFTAAYLVTLSHTSDRAVLAAGEIATLRTELDSKVDAGLLDVVVCVTHDGLVPAGAPGARGASITQRVDGAPAATVPQHCAPGEWGFALDRVPPKGPVVLTIPVALSTFAAAGTSTARAVGFEPGADGKPPALSASMQAKLGSPRPLGFGCGQGGGGAELGGLLLLALYMKPMRRVLARTRRTSSSRPSTRQV